LSCLFHQIGLLVILARARFVGMCVGRKKKKGALLGEIGVDFVIIKLADIVTLDSKDG
jgi:hypothetical protein